MSATWPIVELGRVLKHRKEFIEIDDLTTYARPRVRLHAQGIVQRDRVLGAEIKTKKQQVCRPGEFLVAEIDAKVGGFGIVPDELDGSLVSSHYFLFQIDSSKLDRRFLDFYSRTRGFREQVEAQGSTNYAAIRPADVLAYQVPLPPLPEQRRIVARIEAIAGKVEEARRLRGEAEEEAAALRVAELSRLFDATAVLPAGWRLVTLGEMLERGGAGITTGPFGTLLQKSDIQEYGVPILGIANVAANNFVSGFRDFVTAGKAAELNTYHVEPGDIVIARSGTVGRSCLIPPGLMPCPIMSTNLIRVRLRRDVLRPDILCRLLNGSKLVEDHKYRECRGSSRSFFTHKILTCFRVPVPPLQEQVAIARKLSELDATVNQLCSSQRNVDDGLVSMMPAVLDKAFRGEI